MPSEYAGRRYRISGGVKEITLEFDPAHVPFNESSIEWWDYAQYSTCFSTQTKVLPVIPRFEVLDRSGDVDGRLTLEVCCVCVFVCVCWVVTMPIDNRGYKT
jgi:hypothetical protein